MTCNKRERFTKVWFERDASGQSVPFYTSVVVVTAGSQGKRENRSQIVYNGYEYIKNETIFTERQQFSSVVYSMLFQFKVLLENYSNYRIIELKNFM